MNHGRIREGAGANGALSEDEIRRFHIEVDAVKRFIIEGRNPLDCPRYLFMDEADECDIKLINSGAKVPRGRFLNEHEIAERNRMIMEGLVAFFGEPIKKRGRPSNAMKKLLAKPSPNYDPNAPVTVTRRPYEKKDIPAIV